jgi:hypothetical protein
MFWSVTSPWKDKNVDEPGLPERTPVRPAWSTLVVHQRPQSTGANVKRKRSAINTLAPAATQRPNTAPALLTGEGLLVQSTHGDDFLQHIEDSEVKRVITNQRKENLTQKVLKDGQTMPELYALKVWHNSCARSRGYRRWKAEQWGGSESSMPSPVSSESQSERLQELERTLDGNMRHHYKRLGVQRPPVVIGGHRICTIDEGETTSRRTRFGTAFQQEFEKLFRSSTATTSQFVRSGSAEIARTAPVQSGSWENLPPVKGRRRGLIGRTISGFSTQSQISPLVRVAKVLLKRYGSFRLAFKSIATTGALHMGDWEKVLRDLAPRHDANHLFAYLGKNAQETISLDEFDDVFHQQH